MLLSLFCVAIGLYAQAPNRYLDINPNNEAPGSVTSVRTAPAKDFAATLAAKIAEEVAREDGVDWIADSRLFLVVFREKTDDPLQIRGYYFREVSKGSWLMIDFTEISRGDPASATREVIRKIRGLPPQKMVPIVPSKTSA